MQAKGVGLRRLVGACGLCTAGWRKQSANPPPSVEFPVRELRAVDSRRAGADHQSATPGAVVLARLANRIGEPVLGQRKIDQTVVAARPLGRQRVRGRQVDLARVARHIAVRPRRVVEAGTALAQRFPQRRKTNA